MTLSKVFLVTCLNISCLLGALAETPSVKVPRLLQGFSEGYLEVGDNDRIPLRVARSEDELTQGVSGVLDFEMPLSLGVYFDFGNMGKRTMWMPNTYFDLDLYCFDERGKLTDRILGLKKHPGHSEPPKIPVGKTMRCRSILELKVGHPWSKRLKIGQVYPFRSEKP